MGADGIEPRLRDRAASACEAPRRGDRRRQRGHAAAPAAGLARRAGERGLDPRRRRLDPSPSGRPDRGAAAPDGRPARVPGRPPPASADRGRSAPRHRVRDAGRQRPGQVLPAVRRPACRGRDADRRAAAQSRPQRADARRRRRRDRARRGRRHGAPGGAPRTGRDRRPGRLLLSRLLRRRGAARPRQRGRPRPGSASTRPAPDC